MPFVEYSIKFITLCADKSLDSINAHSPIARVRQMRTIIADSRAAVQITDVFLNAGRWHDTSEHLFLLHEADKCGKQ